MAKRAEREGTTWPPHNRTIDAMNAYKDLKMYGNGFT
jgi:hypothetical protein